MQGAARQRRALGARLVRSVLAVGILLLGILVVTRSVASAIADRSIGAAFALAPGDARLAAHYARERLAAEPGDVSAQNEAAALARGALARDLTAVQAAATLGLVAQLRGETGKAGRWFGYASWLSRRDLPTELWLIEEAVARGDIPGSLRHYDIALRTQVGAGDILLPVLARASGDARIGDALATILGRRPPWGKDFMTYLAQTTSEPRAASALLEKVAARGGSVPASASAQLVAALANQNDWPAAWSYYSSTRRGVDRRRSRNPYFAETITAPAIFDWTPATDSGISASIQTGAERGLLVYSVAPTIGGMLVQQMQLLPPGRYTIEGHARNLRHRTDDAPFWSLKCTRDGHDLVRGDGGRLPDREGRFTISVTVPANCPAQKLVLNARPSNDVEGINGELDYVEIKPQPTTPDRREGRA